MKLKVSSFQMLTILLNFSLFMILLAVVWGIVKGEISLKFNEAGFITKYSALQLFSCGVISGINYKIVKKRIWMLIGIGFVYLSLDELFLIHENLDHLIHHIFNIQETAFSDRIDDFIILLYGIVGGIFMIKNKNVFLSNRSGLIILGSGFVLMVFSVIADTLGNTDLSIVLESSQSVNSIDSANIHHVMTILEEGLKVVSESFLLAGFYAYWLSAKCSVNTVE